MRLLFFGLQLNFVDWIACDLNITMPRIMEHDQISNLAVLYEKLPQILFCRKTTVFTKIADILPKMCNGIGENYLKNESDMPSVYPHYKEV